MLAGGAGQEQLGRGLVHLHHEVEVLHRHLAGAAAAAVGEGAGLRLAPREDSHVDFALVLGVLAFALDAVDLQKISQHAILASPP